MKKEYPRQHNKTYCFWNKPKSEEGFMFRGEKLGYNSNGDEEIIYVYVYERSSNGKPYLIIKEMSKNSIKERLRKKKEMKEINEL